MGGAWLYSHLLLSAWYLAGRAEVVLELETDRDWDWGSGLQELLHSFPADSPFVTETPGGLPVNCSQRFWLPPSSPVCWDNVAEPEEFERSRLLALQNRAALRAVAEASGLMEGDASYSQQAQEEVLGIRAEHRSIVETAETMQKVFLDLEEERREGTERWALSSLRDQLGTTKESIHDREQLAGQLERQLTSLEGSLQFLQLRLAKFLAR